MTTQSSEYSKPQSLNDYLWHLQRDGFYIIRDALPRSSIAALDRELDCSFANAPFCEGDFYGRQTKRFGGLLNRSETAAGLIQHPLILDVADGILGPWCDRFNLNLTQGIEIHPGAPAQFPHRDQDMWDGTKGEVEYLLNVMWPLSSFTAENGATKIWPGSHYQGAADLPMSSGEITA